MPGDRACRLRRWAAATLLMAVCGVSASGQQITKMSICAPNGDNPSTRACNSGSDTERAVLAPGGDTLTCPDGSSGNTINCYAGKGISDEHSSVFPPHSFVGPNGAFNSGYFMSLDQSPGSLLQNGYVLYLNGGLTCGDRTYSSRAFTITAQ